MKLEVIFVTILSIILAVPLTAMAQGDGHGYRAGDVLRKQQVAVEFEYDANGNLVKDKDQSITKITYDVLNMPQKISKGDGYEQFTYDADGQKLESKYYAEKVHIIHPGTDPTIPG